MKKQWFFLVNPFLRAIFSYLLGVRVSQLHDAALNAASADPDIAALYQKYHPIHKAYVAAHDDWWAQGGTQKSETLNLKQLLKLCQGSKSKFWESSVSIVYAPGTVEYTAVLPNKRKPFRARKQSAQISAVEAFSIALAAYPLLAAVKTDVDAFITLINAANTTQKGSKTTTKSKSTAMETAFVNMCEAQYSNLGALIAKYYKTPLVIKQYFDMPVLHRADQVLFHGHAPINKNYFIVKHTLGAADQVKLTNLGNTDLKFYLSDKKTGAPGAIAVTVIKGTNITVTAADLGGTALTYLMVHNVDVLVKGEYMVEFL